MSKFKFGFLVGRFSGRSFRHGRKLALSVLMLLAVAGVSLIWSCATARKLEAGHVKDEALLAGRSGESFPAADEDYFRDMDYGVTKNPEAVRKSLDPYLAGISAQDAFTRTVKGRNNWI